MGPVEVSVIVPTLDEESYLPALLKSLSKQTFKAFEVLVVDGGSQDRTVAEALEFKARVLVKKSNIAEARNIGAALSSARFLVFLDADTVVRSDFLETAVATVRQGGAGLIMARPEPLEPSLTGRVGYLLGWALCRAKLTNPCYMGMGLNREVFNQVNGFDERLAYSEDLDLLRRVSKIVRPRFPKGLVSYNSTRRWMGRGAMGKLEVFLILGRILEYFLLRRSRSNYPIYHRRQAEAANSQAQSGFLQLKA